MSEVTLPNSWANPPISECCDLNPKLDKSQFADSQLVHFVPMPAVEALTNKVDVSATRTFAEVKKGYTPFSSGDVLFAKITPCMENGKMVVVPDLPHGLAFGSTEFHVIRPRGGLDPLWFFYFLSSRSYRSNAEHNMTGAVGQRRVPIDFIAKSPIPLPPLAEQKRIVAKIEELFSELEAGEESLRVARRQLGVYRQSLLKQAFEGHLTAKWRTQNPAKLESPAQLLARIQSARQTRYEEQLKKWENSDQEKRRPRKLEESAPLTADELSDLPELPDCWKWVHPDALVSHEPYSLGIGPFGSNLKVSDYTESGVPLVFVKNITRNDFSLEPRFVSEAKAQGLSAHTTVGGDLLITKMGDPPGDCAIYPIGSPEAVITADCLKFRVLADYCDRGFYCSFINSVVCKKQLGFITRGVAQKKISVERFKSIAVPLCSLPEQQEIVRLLDEQFEVIERNEREIDGALRQSEALRQAILQKAFTGRLVPQSPADEPASQLLARLRAERDADVSSIKSSRQSKAR